MDVRILGPFEVWEGTEQIGLDAPRQRAILALLTVHADEVLSTDRIVDELWGDDPPSSPQNALRYHVSKLRKSLGEAAVHLVTRSPGYVLDVAPEAIDAHRFEELAAEGRGLIPNEPERATRVLVDALGMWRGSPLADFTYESFARSEITRLEELRLSVLEDRVDADLASGRQGDLVGELEALVAEHPLRERLWGQLMTALYRSGRQAEALRAYQQARDALGEIGIEPSDELRAVEEQVLLQDPVLQAVRRSERRHNLPERVSSFVGREQELCEIQGLIDLHRLVTVTGVGGVGKTSVAVEAVRGLTDGFVDGVWMVPVASLGDPGLIVERLATALGLDLQPGSDGFSAVCDHLATREALILFDACERHVADVATLTERLLAASPRLRVLATSREPLQVGGEARLQLGVMDYEGRDSAALHLFEERARLVDATFRLTDANATAATRICEKVAGIPLAVELAAARLGPLSVEQLNVRLDDQMALLVRGRGDRTRHDSLRATLDWSHDLLNPVEQGLFHRLAVFRGGFTMQAAEEVCSNEEIPRSSVVNLVSRLSDASLVDSRQGRFWMLDPIQQYATTHLEEHALGTLGTRHARHYLELAQRLSDEIFGPEEVQALRNCEIEEPNFVAAISWSLDNDESALALGIAAALTLYWRGTARIAVLARFADPLLERARATPSTDSVILLCHSAFNEIAHGNARSAIELATEALTMARMIDDAFAVGHALFRLATVVEDTGLGIDYTRQAIEILDTIGHPWSIDGLFNLSVMLASYGDDTGESLREAFAVASRLLERANELGVRSRQAAAHQALAEAAKYRDDLDEARYRYELAISIDAELGNRRWIVANLMSLAQIELGLGRIDRSRELIQEIGAEYEEAWGRTGRCELEGLLHIAEGDLDSGAAALFEAAEHTGVDGVVASAYGGVPSAAVIYDLAEVGCLRGKTLVSAMLHGAASALREHLHHSLTPRERSRLDQTCARLRIDLGDDAFERAWSDGEAMTSDEALAFARESLPIGEV